ncbi:hypothetical protein F5Y14DRAFT_407915 [Nemania sp. NC0429]|nr:hypothetical protein F5Y14DRAFT_407915 [Nemania sp. NC0429]
MASHDVRDVLNLPADGTGPRPSKKQKIAAPRPNLKGLAREVQSLGGDNPIAIVPEIATFKKRRFGSRKPAARWELTPFLNSARDDLSLQLRHWKKETEDQSRATSQPQSEGPTPGPNGTDAAKADAIEDSGFAKFNVQVDVPQYSEDQYNSNLVSDDWTKDETDYLFTLARDFDLRWPIIWDRYEYGQEWEGIVKQETNMDDPDTAMVSAPKPRTMEDLKKRYYEVAAKMMAVQKPVQYMTQAEFSLHETMANFNPATEIQRKKFAQDALSRTVDEAREEEQLLIEVRRIVARQQRLNLDRQDLYRRLDFPPTEQDITSFKSSSGLSTLLQNLATVDRSKKRRPILDVNGVNTPGSAHPPGHPNATPVSESRRESIAASAGGHRDSIGGSDRPERPTKKGAQQQQQQERRKLTEQEEKIYGVSHHDRLPSGPTFRYERINKILTTKSNAQHQRITNTLTELDIPSRLNMPTRTVVESMEKLLNSINVLLEIRKLNDKLDGEIRLEQAKKAERKKSTTLPTPNTGTEAEAGTSAEAQSEGASASTTEDANAVNGESTDSATANKTSNGEDGTATKTDTNGIANGEEDELTDDNESESSPHPKGGVGEEKTMRPGSSGRHKRSASELSENSEKSTKRQKK